MPSIPSLPPIKIHLPKPQERATFTVIVEGKATSEVESELSGEAATCRYFENGTVKDTSTYLRGRGVDLEFDRYGKEVLIHRSGRETDTSLAVVIATVRTATGGSHAEPAHGGPCTVPPYQLSQNADCGKTFDEKGAMLLDYEGSAFGLSISRNTILGGAFDDECGVDPQTGLPSEFLKAWPTPPKLEKAYLAMGRIFNKRIHSLAIPFLSSDLHIRAKERREVGTPALGGVNTETAFNEATVRLIREKNK